MRQRERERESDRDRERERLWLLRGRWLNTMKWLSSAPLWGFAAHGSRLCLGPVLEFGDGSRGVLPVVVEDITPVGDSSLVGWTRSEE